MEIDKEKRLCLWRIYKYTTTNMKTKQGVIIAIIGCIVWLIVSVFITIENASAFIINANSNEFILQRLISNIASLFTAMSFTTFFVYQYIGKYSKGIYLFAIAGTSIWCIFNVYQLIVDSKTLLIRILNISEFTYLRVLISCICLATSIVFLIYFILDYSNQNKKITKAQTQQITIYTAISGTVSWLIFQLLVAIELYMIYSQYNIPLSNLSFNMITFITPICFLIYFSTQLSAIRKR